MPGQRIDQALVDDILGGDPLLTPAEAAAILGVDEMELTDMGIPAVRLASAKTRRYRTSAITRVAGQQRDLNR